MSSSAQNWSLPGGGVSRDPSKLYYDSVTDKLIAAGTFRQADNKWITGIGTWDGNNWDSLAHGLNFFDTLGNPNAPQAGNVWGMERFNGYLYCGGSFIKAGTISCNAFARWNGSDWDSVPGGKIATADYVKDVRVFGNELYICGSFDSVGNVLADGIAKWDGTTWSAIGPNYDFATGPYSVSKMEFYHGDLYISGVFPDPQGNDCHLGKWDGANWTFLTNEFVGGICFLNDLEVYNDELYVSGLFFSSAGNIATSIVRWNDTTWRDVGGSIEIGATNPYPTVCDMTVHNGKLFCVGNFEIIGGIQANHIASWDGTNWCGYGSMFDNKILQVAFYNDTMFVAGGFWTIDGDTTKYIARWIGGSFVDTCGNTTEVEEYLSDPLVSVYPNPASDIITFQFSGDQHQRQLVIHDALSKEVWRDQTDQSSLSISVQEFSEGIYFYSIVTENGIEAQGKFLVQ